MAASACVVWMAPARWRAGSAARPARSAHAGVPTPGHAPLRKLHASTCGPVAGSSQLYSSGNGQTSVAGLRHHLLWIITPESPRHICSRAHICSPAHAHAQVLPGCLAGAVPAGCMLWLAAFFAMGTICTA